MLESNQTISHQERKAAREEQLFAESKTNQERLAAEHKDAKCLNVEESVGDGK
jgi:hypothetical protein